jgi:putative DNA methylase
VDLFAPRQLLALDTVVDEFGKLTQEMRRGYRGDSERFEAVTACLALAVDKVVDYNSRLAVWDSTRYKIAHTFSRHDFRFKWSHAEYDLTVPRLGISWVVAQVSNAYRGISDLAAHSNHLDQGELYTQKKYDTDSRIHVTQGSASSLSGIPDEHVVLVCVDPPYYDNVIYSECADFFYVWLKRTYGVAVNKLFKEELMNKDDEAVANWARFKEFGKGKKKSLARLDYERKTTGIFTEINRIVRKDGVVVVMFTHKEVEAWETLGIALVTSGFRIDASWPVHTESEHSLHQAKKNAAASTILLVCRKRESTSEPAWWDDLKGQVRETARETAERFEREGIHGVDLYISTFGPVLSIISERWPVLTSNVSPKTGDPIPLLPGEALDLARREVIELRKRGLLLGRSVEFDPVTDWYLMAWDAFRAQEFPADEARKLALALGLDLEGHLIRDKRLVSKKAKNVIIALPATRRKKGMVDTESESFSHLIDALHTAMMVYEEDGSKACQVFIDRHGLRNDSRIKALVQAAMQAIPPTRGKDGKYLRPEMTTLDALRLLVWEDLPAPPEEEAPKVDTQMLMFSKHADEDELGDETDEELDEDAEDEESDDE